MSSASMLEAALAYAREGIPVFPLSGKVPFKGTHGYLDATTDESVIRRMWTEHPGANVGMPTGATTGVFVIDPDGPKGERTLAELEAEHGPLPETHEVRTGRSDGGRHLYFHQNAGVKIKSKDSLLGPKLDIKGDGGYVVLPPSIHPETRKEYSIVRDGVPAEPPEWLLESVRDAGPKQKSPTANTKGPKIPYGKHDSELTRIAGKLRRDGLEENAIYAALTEICEKRCENYGVDYQKMCKKIACSVCKHEPYVLQPISCDDLFSDSANADLVLAKNPNLLLYCNDEDQWYYAEGQRWKRDRTNAVYSRVEKAFRERLWEVVAKKNKSEIGEGLQTLSHYRYTSCLRVLEGRQEIQALPEEFDANPMLLGVQNGILDLKSRRLRELTLALRVANCAPVVFLPRAKPKKFIKYLKRVQPDKEIQKLLQRIFGICLSGYQVEACFIFFHGVGANGKSVFIYLIHSLLGPDYAFKAQKQLIFMPERGERAAAANDLVDLRGKRIITSNETAARNWNTIFIKEFTGGEPMHGRQLYQRAINFKPQGKIIVSANEKPHFDKVQEAERRRFVYIPWDVIIPEKDRISPVSRYAEMLLEGEGKSGILNWALDGLAEVIKNDWKLTVPASISTATEKYLSESDRVRQFISTRVNDIPSEPSAKISTKEMRVHYLAYLGGHNPKFFIRPQTFTAECERIFGKQRCERGAKNMTWVHGVSLQKEAIDELGEWQGEEHHREPGEDEDELPF